MPTQRALAFFEDVTASRRRWLERGRHLRDGRLIKEFARPLYARHFVEAPDFWPLSRDVLEHEHRSARVLRCERAGEEAIVDLHVVLIHHTIRDARPLPVRIDRYLAFDMARVAGDWRIVRVHDHGHDPAAPFIPPERCDALIARTTGPEAASAWPPLPHGEAPSDRIFTPGYVYVDPDRDERGRERTIEIETIGALDLRSGVIGVGELATFSCSDGPHGFRPLARRVSPGVYPVELSGDADAIRVVFQPATPVTAWHPARALDSSGHVVGADVASSGIYDAASIMRASHRAMQRLIDHTAEEPWPAMHTLCHHHDVAITPSGLGDGAYPVYWGVDAQAQPVCLMIDFLTTAINVERTVYAPLAMIAPDTRYPVPIPDSPHGAILTWSRQGAALELRVQAPHVSSVRILDTHGVATTPQTRGWRGDEMIMVVEGVSSVQTSTLEITCVVGWHHP